MKIRLKIRMLEIVFFSFFPNSSFKTPNVRISRSFGRCARIQTFGVHSIQSVFGSNPEVLLGLPSTALSPLTKNSSITANQQKMIGTQCQTPGNVHFVSDRLQYENLSLFFCSDKLILAFDSRTLAICKTNRCGNILLFVQKLLPGREKEQRKSSKRHQNETERSNREIKNERDRDLKKENWKSGQKERELQNQQTTLNGRKRQEEQRNWNCVKSEKLFVWLLQSLAASRSIHKVGKVRPTLSERVWQGLRTGLKPARFGSRRVGCRLYRISYCEAKSKCGKLLTPNGVEFWHRPKLDFHIVESLPHCPSVT